MSPSPLPPVRIKRKDRKRRQGCGDNFWRASTCPLLGRLCWPPGHLTSSRVLIQGDRCRTRGRPQPGAHQGVLESSPPVGVEDHCTHVRVVRSGRPPVYSDAPGHLVITRQPRGTARGLSHYSLVSATRAICHCSASHRPSGSRGHDAQEGSCAWQPGGRCGCVAVCFDFHRVEGGLALT